MASVQAEVGDGPQRVPVARCCRRRWVARCADAPDVSATRSGHVAPSDRSPETAAETITGALNRGGAAGPNILPRLQLVVGSPVRTLLTGAGDTSGSLLPRPVPPWVPPVAFCAAFCGGVVAGG